MKNLTRLAALFFSTSHMVFQFSGWHLKIVQGHKNDNECSKGKLLILSLYYHGDLLVQINSFSWRGFQGSCEATVLASQEVAHWQISFKCKPLNLATWHCKILLFAVCKIKIIYHLVWSKVMGFSILISILFLKNSYGEMQLNEYNILNKVKRNVFSLHMGKET